MRTLLTLYNNVLNGLFPDHTAKPATTPTAKDGTPLKAINIDDLTIGWIQALFFQTGNATPNGNPELKDDSQIIDLMRQLFSTAEKQTISASGPVVFGATNHEVEVDLSLGNVSIDQLPVPDFIGQKPHIYGVGSGIGDIAGGTGLYVNGIVFTENTGGVFLDSVSLTEFRAVPGITADYFVAPTEQIKINSKGEMENILLTVEQGNNTSNINTTNVAFSVAFISINEVNKESNPKWSSINSTDILDFSALNAFASTFGVAVSLTQRVQLRFQAESGSTFINTRYFAAYSSVKGDY